MEILCICLTKLIAFLVLLTESEVAADRRDSERHRTLWVKRDDDGDLCSTVLH